MSTQQPYGQGWQPPTQPTYAPAPSQPTPFGQPAPYGQPAPHGNPAARPYAEDTAEPDFVAPWAAGGYDPYQRHTGLATYAPAAPAMSDHPSQTTALILGVLSVTMVPLLGPVAIWLGLRTKRDIKAQPGRYRDSGLSTAAIVTGALGTGMLVFIVIYLLAIALLLMAH